MKIVSVTATTTVAHRYLEGAACRDALASDADRSVFWAHERACLFVEKKDFGAVLYFHLPGSKHSIAQFDGPCRDLTMAFNGGIL